MINSHKDTLRGGLFYFFTNPKSTRQKQYETIRAIIIDKLSIPEAAAKFGYEVNTVYALLRDAKSGKLDLFPEI